MKSTRPSRAKHYLQQTRNKRPTTGQSRHVISLGGLSSTSDKATVDEAVKIDAQNILNLQDDGYSSSATSSFQNNNHLKSTSQFGDTQNVRSVGITATHAAAVNGDKNLLNKLINSNSSSIDAVDKFNRTPLIYCVLGDRLDCAELLIREGAEVNHKDAGGRTPLHLAAHKGNFNFVKLLLSKGADCRSVDNDEQLPLHLSTRHQSVKCSSLLLKQLQPGEVDHVDKDGRTPLHIASSFGYAEHVRLLLAQGSNISKQDELGKSPIHYAAGSKSAEAVSCVEMILGDSDSAMNWFDLNGRTALIQAVAEGNLEVVRALTLMPTCKVGTVDNLYRTALHWAAALGHTEITSVLLNHKECVCTSDENGATPLHYAAQNNFPETVEIFLNNEIADDPDRYGRTAFMWAAGKGANAVIEMFIKHNVDIHVIDQNGANALHAAASAGQPSTVQLLLSHGAHIESLDNRKHTPLFSACEGGQLNVVEVLIKHKCRVKIMDEDGRSPLHWAALEGNANICNLLIRAGIDPNIRDQSGRTPLQCAAYGGYVNCMSILLEHKADSDAQDNEGMTAFHWACSKGYFDAVKLLMEVHAVFNNMEFTEDRYTPLDYALMGEHHGIVQYLIEHGALSITGIQDLAASRIQAAVRGYLYRKTCMQREILFIEHERRLKNPAKRRSEDKKEIALIYDTAVEAPPPIYAGNQSHSQKEGPPSDYASCQSTPKKQPSQSGHAHYSRQTDIHAVGQMDRLTDSGIGSSRSDELLTVSDTSDDNKLHSSSKSNDIPVANAARQHSNSNNADVTHKDCTLTPQSQASSTSTLSHHSSNVQDSKQSDKISGKMTAKKHQQNIKSSELFKHEELHQKTLEERKRLLLIRVKNRSASTIQHAWRRYSKDHTTFPESAIHSHHEHKMNISDDEWQQQIAALTIQLAWRKYYRQKLVRSLTPRNQKILQLWDPAVIAAKQRALVQHIYGTQLASPDFWHPQLSPRSRPTWFKYLPSPAALSYNFAMEQYKAHRHIPTASERYKNSWSYSTTPRTPRSDTSSTLSRQSLENLDPEHFSYNMNR